MKGTEARGIEVRGLSYGVEGRWILRDVSLSVEKGEVVGVVGPNGAGKSTLLRAILRIVRPQEGEVALLGTPVERMSAREMAKRVAFVPQSTVFSFPFTVTEVVMMGRTPYAGRLIPEGRADYALCLDCLRTVEMEGLAERVVTELSHGEKQLVVIARALAQQPEFLLLDEPTSNLDIHHELTIMDLLRRLSHEDGKGVLVVVHDLHLALRYCDKVVVLEGGRVSASGNPRRVLTPALISKVFRVKVHMSSLPETRDKVIVPLAPLRDGNAPGDDG